MNLILPQCLFNMASYHFLNHHFLKGRVMDLSYSLHTILRMMLHLHVYSKHTRVSAYYVQEEEIDFGDTMNIHDVTHHHMCLSQSMGLCMERKKHIISSNFPGDPGLFREEDIKVKNEPSTLIKFVLQKSQLLQRTYSPQPQWRRPDSCNWGGFV